MGQTPENLDAQCNLEYTDNMLSSAASTFKKFHLDKKMGPGQISVEIITSGMSSLTCRVTNESRRSGWFLRMLNPVLDAVAVNTNLGLFESAQAASRAFLPEYWQDIKLYNAGETKTADKVCRDEKNNAWVLMDQIPGDILTYNSFNEIDESDKDDASSSLGEAQIIEPFIAAWLPNFIVLSLGTFLFYKKAYLVN